MTYNIRDLGVISDRRSGALIDRQGNICWFCPKRFDEASIFASLLDKEKGGEWTFILDSNYQVERKYIGTSSILESTFFSGDDSFIVQDWMPLDNHFSGICRLFSSSSRQRINLIRPAPGYGEEDLKFVALDDHKVSINQEHHVLSSHVIYLEGDKIKITIPPGEQAWVVFADQPLDRLSLKNLQDSLASTKKSWENIYPGITYEGPYGKQVVDSIRAIRQLTYGETGGIIAALTTSLPEVLGGERNYDYRYVWLRDASMIVSALTRAGTNGSEERNFLDFICASRKNIKNYSTTPFVTINKHPAPRERYLKFSGYKNSTPARVGNNANLQLQLDAGANVLLAAKLIYEHFNIRDHWETIEEIADFLVENWDKDDHGIWEEEIARQFTSSKVIMTVALEFISKHSKDNKQKERWINTAARIREFIKKECTTSFGAYAVYRGSDEVDIAAALFPEWAFCDPKSEEMIRTIDELEKKFCENDLFYRNLLLFDERKEGAFLAGNFWMAQYWIMMKNYEKSKRYIEAALACQNDLGLFSEEADPNTGTLLGNFPQSFVHASLIGAVIDFKNTFS
ncbi:MAG: glycoside hydrolase family 15 protein [bacterium]